MLTELARSLPNPLDGPSVQLVAFDAEEARGDRDFDVDGTRGSRQYVADARRGGREGAVPLQEIRAMVLFDMVGDCDLRIPLEAELRPGALRAVRGGGHRGGRRRRPRSRAAASPIGDDHVPFLEAGVPAVDLIDFDFGPGPDAGRVLAHARGHARQGLRREPRRGGGGGARRDPADPLVAQPTP